MKKSSFMKFVDEGHFEKMLERVAA